MSSSPCTSQLSGRWVALTRRIASSGLLLAFELFLTIHARFAQRGFASWSRTPIVRRVPLWNDSAWSATKTTRPVQFRIHVSSAASKRGSTAS